LLNRLLQLPVVTATNYSTRMTKLPNKKAGDNIGKNLRGKPHVVTPTLQG
jgi:hypothetical protein